MDVLNFFNNMDSVIESILQEAEPLKDYLLYLLAAHPWKLLVGSLILYWMEINVRRQLSNCKTQFTDSITHEYKLLHSRFEELHSKLDCMEKEISAEIKKKQDEVMIELALMKTSVQDLQVAVKNGSSAGVRPGPASIPGAPPPPPPPLPPLSFITPVSKPTLQPSVSGKSAALTKKPRDGPPQLSFSQAEITSMLRQLRKTSNKSKLLDEKPAKKTPPRRKLFGRNSISGRRRSFTVTSPPADFRTRTPVSQEISKETSPSTAPATSPSEGTTGTTDC